MEIAGYSAAHTSRWLKEGSRRRQSCGICPEAGRVLTVATKGCFVGIVDSSTICGHCTKHRKSFLPRGTRRCAAANR